MHTFSHGYAIRHKGYVRIHISMRILQVNLWYLYIPYVLVHISALSDIVRGIRLIPGWCQPVIPVTPVQNRAHATINLHQLKPALDADRSGWRCKQRAFTDVVEVEIGGALVAFEEQNSMHTYRQTDKGSKK